MKMGRKNPPIKGGVFILQSERVFLRLALDDDNFCVKVWCQMVVNPPLADTVKDEAPTLPRCYSDFRIKFRIDVV